MNISVSKNGVQYRGKQTYKQLYRLYSNHHNREMAIFYGNLYHEAKARVHNIKFMQNEKAYLEKKSDNTGFISGLKSFSEILQYKTKMIKEKLLSTYYNKI